MAWVRSGDNAAMHPRVLAIHEHELFDDRLVNEVMGFFIRCAQQSGSHSTDYVVNRGTAVLIANASRVDVVVAVALWAGLMTEVQLDDDRVGFKLIDDDPDFLHLRLKAEIDWEKQRKLDNARPSLIVPVRLRDGDGCRWCGVIVNWATKNGGRSGTYDHLHAGVAAEVATSVVCCRSCNSSRGNGELPSGIDHLLPVPDQPYFSAHTVQWLTDNKWRQTHNLTVPPASSPQIAPGKTPDGSQPPTRSARTDTMTATAAAVSQSSQPTPSSEALSGTQPGERARDHTPSSTPTGIDRGTRPAAVPVDDESTRPAAVPVDSGRGTQSPAVPATPVGAQKDAHPPDCRRPQTSAVEQGPGSADPGRGGTGRDGAGLVSSPPDHLSTDRSLLRRRRRGGRGRRRSVSES